MSLLKLKSRKQQKNYKVLQEILGLMIQAKTQKTLITLEIKTRLYLPKKKMREIQRTIKGVLREDKLETILLRKINCKRRSYPQV